MKTVQFKITINFLYPSLTLLQQRLISTCSTPKLSKIITMPNGYLKHKILNLTYLYVNGCFAPCMSVNHMHSWCPKRPEEGIRLPRNRVTVSWELPWGWESNWILWKISQGSQLLSHRWPVGKFTQTVQVDSDPHEIGTEGSVRDPTHTVTHPSLLGHRKPGGAILL